MAKLGLIILDSIAEEFSIDRKETSIGRDPDCNISIDDHLVSRRHAIIWHDPTTTVGNCREVYIDDLNSKNGTYVNGLSISRGRLKHDDVISIGSNSFRLSLDCTDAG